jgi:hypothetical protein
MIIVSSGDLGLLKDYSIAKNCLVLLCKGVAARKGTYKVLSFDTTLTMPGGPDGMVGDQEYSLVYPLPVMFSKGIPAQKDRKHVAIEGLLKGIPDHPFLLS